MFNITPAVRLPRSEDPLARPRILVVEDDFLIRMMLAEVLADEGFDVIEAESGDEAFALLDASVALVVTDVQLPGKLNGRALVAEARKTWPDLPVIFTSGRMDPALPLGAREVSIAKPYQSSEICATIRRLLAG
jgi:DNA-binding response OmpR family regulator